VGNIFLSEGFFSTTMTSGEAMGKIRDELCRFAIIVEPAKTMFGKVCTLHQTRRKLPQLSNETNTLTSFVTQVRKTYSGKVGGMQDDLAIALQLAITGLRCFYTNAKYDRFRPEL
jgi:hypothetical protein